MIKGGALPRINVLVDLYNAISVRHLIPVGGEDLDRLEGRLRLTVADGSEAFDGPDAEPPSRARWCGGTTPASPAAAGTGARARTRLTEASTRAFFVFDRLPALPAEALDRATAELSSALRERWPESASRRIVLAARS